MNWDDWLEDIIVVVSFALLAWFIVHGARSDRWGRAFRRLGQDRIGIAAGVVIAIYLMLGALETIEIPSGVNGSRSVLDLFSGRVPAEETYSAPLASVSLSTRHPKPLKGWHLLGTDALGKDVLVQTLRACKTALIIGGVTSAIYIPIGALLGIVAGYCRGWIDQIIQYVYTVLYSIPEILLLIAILLAFQYTDVSLFGHAILSPGKSVPKIALALSVTAWITLCRLIRGETMRQTERAYVSAARAMGQSHWNIITQHLLPNVMHLVLISLVLGFSNLVITEAILSYLGVGSPIGTPSWGNMIDGARGELSRDPVVWWTLTSATMALFGLVLSLNIFGDSLRRAFDPRRG